MAALTSVRNGLATGLGAVLIAGAVTAPVLMYRHLTHGDLVLERHAAVAPSVTDRQLKSLIAAHPMPDSQRPLVLVFHDVRPQAPPSDRYTISPRHLANDLALLRVAGYRSITATQLVGWLSGSTVLPRRSVMLTFDDGASGVWRYADAVLEAQGFRGVVLPITGRVGTHRPYYLTWQELSRLKDSGRWDIESHTRMGHGRILVDEKGTRWPALINRTWFPNEGRLETLDEFSLRVSRDLRGARADLVHHGFPAPTLFAYPFSAEISPTNDPAAPAITRAIVARLFRASMTNVLPDRMVSDRDRTRRSIPRLEVFRATTVRMLRTRIAGAAPSPPRTSAPLRHPHAWTDNADEPLGDAFVTPDIVDRSNFVHAIRFRNERLELRPPDDQYVAANYLMGKSPDWNAYRVRASVSNLGSHEGGPTGSVFGLVGSDRPIQVGVSASYVRVSTTTTSGAHEVLAQRTIPLADSHRVELAVRKNRVAVAVDSLAIVNAAVPAGSSGGVGVAASGGPVTFTAMELSP